jgi:hypothetical protein
MTTPNQTLESAGITMPEATGIELDTITLVLLMDVPDDARFSKDELQQLANDHLAHIIGLTVAGHVLHAGALVDRGTDPKLTGIGLSRLSEDELRPLLEQDPMYQAGLIALRFTTHVFPKGSVQFARELGEGA